MQWIAMFTMLIDHIGAIFFPGQITFRIIGRIAFPLYVYLAVIGYQRTSRFSMYMCRLILLALVSQLPFQYAFGTTHLNVIGTLAISVAVIKCIDVFKTKLYLSIPIILIGVILLDYFPFDYGVYGLLLMILYRYCLKKPMLLLLLHFVLELFFMFVYQWGIQFFSISVTIALAYYQPLITQWDKLRAPKWLWRLFYPLHLTLLFLIVKFLLVN